MTGQQTLVARAVLGVVAGAFSVGLAMLFPLQSRSRRQLDRALYGAFAVSRLGLFAVVFLVLHIAPRGDVPGYYFPQAEQVLGHMVPYRDFVSSYAPLHPYVDAAMISMWHTPLAIMLFSVLAELLLLPFWLQAGREFLPEGELWTASLLYLASPVSLQFVAIDGQDNVVIAVLIGMALWLILRLRILAAGATLGAAVALVKFLPLIYAPAFFVAVPKRWKLVLGAALVCGVVYGGFALLGSPILGPLAAERDLRSAGDLPYLIEAIFGVTLPSRMTDGVLLLVLAGIFLCVGRAAYGAALGARMRALTFGMAAVTLALLVMSKKSWPPYLMLALFPVCLLVWDGAVSRMWNMLRVAGFALFSLVAVAEHSYWATMFAQFSSAEFHSGLRSSGRLDVWQLLGVELLLVGGYLWLLYEAMRRLLGWTSTDSADSKLISLTHSG